MNLNSHYRNVYTQRGEDGILEYIFNTMGIKKGRFVEFGAWDGTYLSNCRLLFERGWGGLFIEGDQQKASELKRKYARSQRVLCLDKMVAERGPNSLDNLLKKYYNHALDFVSIDVDGLDYYLLQSLNRFLPKVICVEGGKYVPPNQKKLVSKKIASEYIGQSLTAFQDLAEKKGYKIICFTQNIIMVQKKYAHLFPVSPNLEELYLAGIRQHSWEDVRYMKTILDRYNVSNPLIEGILRAGKTAFALDMPVNHATMSFKPVMSKHIAKIFPQWQKRSLIKRVSLSQLRASIVVGEAAGVTQVKNVKIEHTPHAKFVRGDRQDYVQYLESYGSAVGYGKEHGDQQFAQLTQKFAGYLNSPHESEYITCYEKKSLFGTQYIILDGVHRAAILQSQNMGRLAICVIRQHDLGELTQFDQYLQDYKDDFLEWYTPIRIKGRTIHERTYPNYQIRKSYLTNRERGESKWRYSIAPYLPSVKGKVVYDIGCNIGLYSVYMAQLGAKQVIGLDRSIDIVQPTNTELPKQSVVQQAYFVLNLHRLAGMKVRDVITYREQDIAQLDFATIKCDLLFSSCVLYHFGPAKFEAWIKILSTRVPEIFLQTNIGHVGGELGVTASVAYQQKVLEKNGYTVRVVAPANYNYPILSAHKTLKRS